MKSDLSIYLFYCLYFLGSSGISKFVKIFFLWITSESFIDLSFAFRPRLHLNWFSYLMQRKYPTFLNADIQLFKPYLLKRMTLWPILLSLAQVTKPENMGLLITFFFSKAVFSYPRFFAVLHGPMLFLCHCSLKQRRNTL